MSEISPFGDGDFSLGRFKERYNADLAKGLGNFFSRVTTVARRFGKIKNNFSLTELFIEQKIKTIQKNVDRHLGEFRFNNALSEIWSLISLGDQYINGQKPWDESESEVKREKALFNLLMILNAVAVLLAPFLPETSKKITSSISLKGKMAKIKKISNLFPRLE